MSNKYASKPFLNAQMASILQYSFTQSAFSNNDTVTWAGTSVTLATDSSANIAIGSYLDLSGTAVGVLAISGSTLTVDLSGNGIYAAGRATISAYTTTVQNALNVFLNDPFGGVSTNVSKKAYYALLASIVAALNSANAANPTSLATGKNGIRAFVAGDDGTPIFDSGKATSGSSNTNQITSLVSSAAPYLGNTYTNFSKKITIGSNSYSTDNTVNDVSLNLVITTGTAGGNAINENHNSRPEFIGALFSPTGIAYSKRSSSTTKSLNYYIAQRVGISSEDNLGAIRLNVPLIEG